MIHSFNIKIAQDVGIEESIVIHFFYYWITKNAANNRHCYNGRYWTYNSSKAMALMFPYMSSKKTWRLIDSLAQRGFIVKGHFSSNAFDRTSWCAFTDKGYELLSSCGYDINAMLDIPKTENQNFQKSEIRISKNGKCNNIDYYNNISNNTINNTIDNTIINNINDDFLKMGNEGAYEPVNPTVYVDTDTEEDDDLAFPYTEEEKMRMKEEREKRSAKKEKEEIDVSPEMQIVIEEWLQYKKERKQTYTKSGTKAFIKKLIKLSDGNPQKAAEIIHESMANNYAGIFPLKMQNPPNKTGVMLNVNDLWK